VADVCFGFHILFAYACWGVALLVIRRWSTGALLLVAALSASARPLFDELVALSTWWTGAAATPMDSALRQAVDVAVRQGDYATLLAARWALFVGSFSTTWREVLPDTNLTLFTIGLLAVRYGLLDEPLRHVRLITAWMILGATAWAASWLVLRHLPALPIPGTGEPLAYGLGLVHDQWLCLTYIGAVVLLLAYRPGWSSRLAVVGSAGRMALTNYMIQAAVLDCLTSGYGLALRLRPYAYVAVAVLLFVAEAALSSAWLARFRFGPLEWVWRTITYARIQPYAAAPTSS
jgi:uncharacterized protein